MIELSGLGSNSGKSKRIWKTFSLVNFIGDICFIFSFDWL